MQYFTFTATMHCRANALLLWSFLLIRRHVLCSLENAFIIRPHQTTRCTSGLVICFYGSKLRNFEMCFVKNWNSVLMSAHVRFPLIISSKKTRGLDSGSVSSRNWSESWRIQRTACNVNATYWMSVCPCPRLSYATRVHRREPSNSNQHPQNTKSVRA